MPASPGASSFAICGSIRTSAVIPALTPPRCRRTGWCCWWRSRSEADGTYESDADELVVRLIQARAGRVLQGEEILLETGDVDVLEGHVIGVLEYPRLLAGAGDVAERDALGGVFRRGDHFHGGFTMDPRVGNGDVLEFR